MFKFITHKSLLVNILFAVLVLMLLVVLFFFSLGWLTGHNETEKVPVVTGKHIDAAIAVLKAKGFNVEVADSIFDATQPKLQVLKQSPEPEALVKKGRTVYLTVNRMVAPTIEMPNLIGQSIKSAMQTLEDVGLKLGDTTYKFDIGKNTVLSQSYAGNEIKPGAKISIGSSISLVLGSGIGNIETDVPDLTGKTYADALSVLGNMTLSVGSAFFEAGIKDSAKAYVVRQEPAPFFEPLPGQKVAKKIRQGEMIDIWLSIEPPKIDSSSNTPATNNNANEY